jgi:RNA polymerase sigma-70 factor (ECF subfamily)
MESAIAIAFPLPSVREAATMRPVAAIQPTDEELLARVADGDHAAFGDLYQRYARAVLGLAIRRLGDRGRAEDAVQEAFTSIWRAARTYRSERGPVAPWLYAVARNAIADRGRARTEPPAEPTDAPSDEPGPDDRAERSWVAYRVHRALEDLPETERTVLELAYWSGLSQSEIANFLGIPLGTVKTRTRSGLHRLADALDEELG